VNFNKKNFIVDKLSMIINTILNNIQAPILQNNMKILQISMQEKINGLKKYFKNH
jgi:hypothetical protein